MDNVDLNSNISAQSSVTNQTPAFEQPVSKKRLSPLVIILSIVVLLLAGAAVVLFFMLPKEEDTPTTQNQQQQQTELMDVSEYTDIVLVDYDGLEVSFPKTFEEQPEQGYMQGLVVYSRKLGERMSIINKSTISEEDITEHYEPAYDDILNSNIDAQWWDQGGEPWVLLTSNSGSNQLPLVEIKGVEYQNTDNVFAVLSLTGGQDFPHAGNEDSNFDIIIFAIKGDNLIRLQSLSKNLMQELLLSEEENESCSLEPDEYADFASYNPQCLKDVFKSGKYDTQLQAMANELVSSFEIAN